MLQYDRNLDLRLIIVLQYNRALLEVTLAGDWSVFRPSVWEAVDQVDAHWVNLIDTDFELELAKMCFSVTSQAKMCFSGHRWVGFASSTACCARWNEITLTMNHWSLILTMAMVTIYKAGLTTCGTSPTLRQQCTRSSLTVRKYLTLKFWYGYLFKY